MEIIYVSSTSELPKRGKLLDNLPPESDPRTVYVFDGTPIRGRYDDGVYPWRVIVASVVNE